MRESRIFDINHGVVVLLALVLMVFVLSASTSCTSHDVVPNGQESSVRSIVPDSVEQSVDSLSKLIRALWETDGSFEPSGFGGSWVFNGDRSVIIAVARFEDSAVAPLIDCMGEFQPARATVNGRPVMRGTMCAEVLRIGVIYEATDSLGEFDDQWPGYTDPMATEGQLRAAQAAWRDVLDREAYIIP